MPKGTSKAHSSNFRRNINKKHLSSQAEVNTAFSTKKYGFISGH